MKYRIFLLGIPVLIAPLMGGCSFQDAVSNIFTSTQIADEIQRRENGVKIVESQNGGLRFGNEDGNCGWILPNFENEQECPICLFSDETKEDFGNAIKLDCFASSDHIFHAKCIDSWLKTNTTCPVCRNLVSFDYLENISQEKESIERLKIIEKIFTHHIPNGVEYETNMESFVQIVNYLLDILRGQELDKDFENYFVNALIYAGSTKNPSKRLKELFSALEEADNNSLKEIFEITNLLFRDGKYDKYDLVLSFVLGGEEYITLGRTIAFKDICAMVKSNKKDLALELAGFISKYPFFPYDIVSFLKETKNKQILKKILYSISNNKSFMDSMTSHEKFMKLMEERDDNLRASGMRDEFWELFYKAETEHRDSTETRRALIRDAVEPLCNQPEDKFKENTNEKFLDLIKNKHVDKLMSIIFPRMDLYRYHIINNTFNLLNK